ncbi:ArnT family glycosyltransferase [Pseudomonas viridiflava]|uniref:Glycosyl transferase family protein n=1 Tax=Pseudomonas viridiflava TaxID=33069 RepID=A0A1Y6JIL4_PSEVI|nr:phospholipid carrier-dependent glycosyltransferase [Pseudomonas viridiflava]VVM58546.1 Undecaprenyl phosphate-alpha-4-amino-4-deoxy-L-arabinose arabinosyl transferase [Pseudomonas fluorescens]MBV1815890.1 phospholipid carrier-dependent glycosyltransferase [Pseudomonas viridiflava]MCQ9392973.1 phospholipid carrier-dependent glycosyltransferase [Pseudomonas viridiflava]MEE4140600.1 phospholipid carrier-dependent glycosyltransferase [Pseudomonas viridiflava]WKW32551.1 phospholipid carrier-depe
MLASRTLWLLMLSVLLFFFALGNHQLQSSTEPRVAGIAMEMQLTDNWVTPTLSRQPFLEKPPLSVWLDASAIRLFGATPWAVRLASAFAGLFSVLLLYAMLKRMGRPVPVAWLAAFMLATLASFWGNSRQVGEDALLALGVTLALLMYVHAVNQAPSAPRTTWSWWLFTLGIAISTLSKGVLGLALPGVVIFAWLLCEMVQQRRLVIADWLRPAAFTLLGLIPLMVWLYFLYGQGGVQSLKDVLWTNSVGRFDGSFQEAGHYEPLYYYIAKLPEAFMPWNLLVYLGLWHFRRQLLANRYLLFFSLWLVAQFVLLTLASSKRMVYLMSSAPAAAVIAAEYAAVLGERLKARSRSSAIAAFAVRHQRALMTTGIALTVAAYLWAAVWLMPREDRHFSFVPLATTVQALQAQGHQVALFQPSERLSGASAFYVHTVLDAYDSDASVNRFLMSDPRNVAIMERTSEPAPPLKAIQHVKVGSRSYYFVSYDRSTPGS